MSLPPLGQLQTLDSANDAARKRLSELDVLIGDESGLSAARAQLEASEARLVLARKALGACEQDTRLLETRMTDLERRLYGGTVRNPKELENLQRELEMFRHQHEQFDEKALNLMEAAEKSEADASFHRQHVAHLQSERTGAVSAWALERQRVSADLTARLEAVKQARALVPEDLLEAYDRLRHRMPLAAVPLRRGLCGACGIGVPDEVSEQARSGQEVARCDNCGRILYVG